MAEITLPAVLAAPPGLHHSSVLTPGSGDERPEKLEPYVSDDDWEEVRAALLDAKQQGFPMMSSMLKLYAIIFPVMLLYLPLFYAGVINFDTHLGLSIAISVVLGVIVVGVIIAFFVFMTRRVRQGKEAEEAARKRLNTQLLLRQGLQLAPGVMRVSHSRYEGDEPITTVKLATEAHPEWNCLRFSSAYNVLFQDVGPSEMAFEEMMRDLNAVYCIKNSSLRLLFVYLPVLAGLAVWGLATLLQNIFFPQVSAQDTVILFACLYLAVTAAGMTIFCVKNYRDSCRRVAALQDVVSHLNDYYASDSWTLVIAEGHEMAALNKCFYVNPIKIHIQLLKERTDDGDFDYIQ